MSKIDDRELIRLAGKAARIEVLYYQDTPRDVTGMHPSMNIVAAPVWNPLVDCGDALRLAVKLAIDVGFGVSETGDFVCALVNGEAFYPTQTMGQYATTCRAITQAAAGIGKAMP